MCMRLTLTHPTDTTADGTDATPTITLSPGVAKYLKPAVAGFLLQKELDYLEGAVAQPKRPFAAIVGGSKVSTKITVIETLLNKVSAEIDEWIRWMGGCCGRQTRLPRFPPTTNPYNKHQTGGQARDRRWYGLHLPQGPRHERRLLARGGACMRACARVGLSRLLAFARHRQSLA